MNFLSQLLAESVVSLITRRILAQLEAAMVIGKLVTHNFEPSVQYENDTVNVPRAPLLTAYSGDNKKEIQARVQYPELFRIPVELTKHLAATFKIINTQSIVDNPWQLDIYLKLTADALAKNIDLDLLKLYPQFTANVPIGRPGAPIIENIIDQAETLLWNAKASTDVPYYLAVSPAEYTQLSKHVRFDEKKSTYKSFSVVPSTSVCETGTSPRTTHNLAFAGDAMCLVTRRLPMVPAGLGVISGYAENDRLGVRVLASYHPDPYTDDLSIMVTIDMLYEAAVMRNSFGVQVSS